MESVVCRSSDFPSRRQKGPGGRSEWPAQPREILAKTDPGRFFAQIKNKFRALKSTPVATHSANIRRKLIASSGHITTGLQRGFPIYSFEKPPHGLEFISV